MLGQILCNPTDSTAYSSPVPELLPFYLTKIAPIKFNGKTHIDFNGIWTGLLVMESLLRQCVNSLHPCAQPFLHSSVPALSHQWLSCC